MAPAMKMSFCFRKFIAPKLGRRHQGIVGGYLPEEVDLPGFIVKQASIML